MGLGIRLGDWDLELELELELDWFNPRRVLNPAWVGIRGLEFEELNLGYGVGIWGWEFG